MPECAHLDSSHVGSGGSPESQPLQGSPERS